MRGTRAVQQSIVEAYPDADISVSIVWIHILEHDTEMATQRAIGSITNDPRVRHFYDPERRTGKAIAQSLGGEKDQVAWDMYLFYEKGSEWIQDPPLPTDWMHQLTGSSWADPTHYHSGDDLDEELDQAMSRLVVRRKGA